MSLPIDTLPPEYLDGRDVLIWGTLHNKVANNSWHVAAYRRGWWSGGATMSHITHWAPVPPAPK